MKINKIIIAFIVLAVINTPVCAESLFRAGISQENFPIVPRSLFSSVKAKGMGDIVTVVISESLTSSDVLSLDISKKSTTTDNFSSLLNKLLPGKPVPSGINNFGGSHTNASQSTVGRTKKFTDIISTQVVQVLPNGNLVIQGKKTEISHGEKVDLIISGIIDPRLLSTTGTINSSQIANLQLAVVGKGTISRSDSEGTVNKVIRYLF
ncbi:MAG: flagellar basal body L-ring protein FlgH [Candidatus Gastranaerophilales bacterium]|nr:flagellar basal body L-ring protein FlgH [Candidatus Gastranaerophilales bacterium]